MSTLRVDNIENSSGSSSPITIPGTAKAWVNFNGTGTVAIRASYNVSSITDNGTGDYTVTFTTAMPDANYAWTGAIGYSVASTTAILTVELPDNVAYGTSKTSSALQVETNYANSTSNRTQFDPDEINVAIFR